jgi:hypothetical protein
LSQKRAAIDVVAKRLKQIDLEDFFIAVHDPHAERRSVINKIKSIRAKLTGPAELAAADDYTNLSQEIEQTEKYLDAYIDALYQKKEPLGLSYRQVITTIRQQHDKNPILAPDDELADLVSSLDRIALDKALTQIRTIAEDWLTAQPLQNPWRYMKEGIEIENPFEITKIGNLLADLLSLDEKHSEFVSKNPGGCSVDADVHAFIEDGNLVQKLLLENKKALGHVLRWFRDVGADGLQQVGSIESVILGAIRCFENIVRRPYDRSLHR